MLEKKFYSIIRKTCHCPIENVMVQNIDVLSKLEKKMLKDIWMSWDIVIGNEKKISYNSTL